MIDVSIILVNYKSAKMTCDCIKSICFYTKDLSYEIIVVDNASNDGSVEYISSAFPNVKIIASDKNLGFGSGNNLGVKSAQGKYIFFLNNDTLLENNAVKQFYDFYEESKIQNLGVIGTFLLNPDGTPGHSVGDFPNVWIEPVATVFKRMFKIQKEFSISENTRVAEVDFISGADMFLQKDTIEKYGGFDENFFMFYEETELQFRYKKAGLRNFVIRGPKIIHLEGKSFSNKNRDGMNFKRITVYKSHYYYTKTTMSSFNFFWYKNFYLIKAVLTFIFSILRAKYSLKQNLFFITEIYGNM